MTMTETLSTPASWSEENIPMPKRKTEKKRKRTEPARETITDPNDVVKCVRCQWPFTPTRIRGGLQKTLFCNPRCRQAQWEIENPRLPLAEHELYLKLKEKYGKSLSALLNA